MLNKERDISQLEQGEADVAVGGFTELAAGIREQTLYEDRYVCVMREGHPLCTGKLSQDAFCSAKHILVRAHTVNHVQQEVEYKLLELLPQSSIRLISESFVAAMLMASRSDLILTAPSGILAYFEKHLRLVGRQMPMKLPIFFVKQYWHERFENDPGNQWLRRGIRVITSHAPAVMRYHG